MPKNRGNGTGAGLTPFRRKTFLRTKPRFGLFLAGELSFPICSTGSKAMKTCDFRGPVKINLKLLTTSEDLVFLGNCTTKPCWYERYADSNLLRSGTNHDCHQKQIDGLFLCVIIKFSNNNIVCTYRHYFACVLQLV